MHEQQRPISEAQQLQFALMRKASFNAFNGDRVVDDLLQWCDLWDAVIMDRPADGNEAGIDLIKLRDLEDDEWNVSTVYILTSGVDDAHLQAMIEDRWDADEVEFLEENAAAQALGSPLDGQHVLSVWWD